MFKKNNSKGQFVWYFKMCASLCALILYCVAWLPQEKWDMVQLECKLECPLVLYQQINTHTPPQGRKFQLTIYKRPLKTSNLHRWKGLSCPETTLVWISSVVMFCRRDEEAGSWTSVQSLRRRTAVGWLKFELTYVGIMWVSVELMLKAPVILGFGVPQGSVLDPTCCYKLW